MASKPWIDWALKAQERVLNGNSVHAGSLPASPMVQPSTSQPDEIVPSAQNPLVASASSAQHPPEPLTGRASTSSRASGERIATQPSRGLGGSGLPSRRSKPSSSRSSLSTAQSSAQHAGHPLPAEGPSQTAFASSNPRNSGSNDKGGSAGEANAAAAPTHPPAMQSVLQALTAAMQQSPGTSSTPAGPTHPPAVSASQRQAKSAQSAGLSSNENEPGSGNAPNVSTQPCPDNQEAAAAASGDSARIAAGTDAPGTPQDSSDSGMFQDAAGTVHVDVRRDPPRQPSLGDLMGRLRESGANPSRSPMPGTGAATGPARGTNPGTGSGPSQRDTPTPMSPALEQFLHQMQQRQQPEEVQRSETGQQEVQRQKPQGVMQGGQTRGSSSSRPPPGQPAGPVAGAGGLGGMLGQILQGLGNQEGPSNPQVTNATLTLYLGQPESRRSYA